MFYFIAFLIIIIFFIETCKSIKLFDYYKDKFKNTNINNTIKKSKSIDLESFDDIKNITKHGYLPSNVGDSSNYQINPKKTSIQELQEKYDSGLYKYAPSYESSMVYNNSYFNPVKDKYIKNRHELPSDWKCQRPWFDCSMKHEYFNKFKKDKI
jgi:hypothetical protein